MAEVDNQNKSVEEASGAALGVRVVVATIVLLLVLFGLYWSGRKLLVTKEKDNESGPQQAARSTPIEHCTAEDTHRFLQTALQAPHTVCKLIVEDQGLIALPDGVGWMNKLTELDVSNNRLKTLTPKITWMSELRRIDISNNQITQIPDEIGWLRKLEELDAHNNQLTIISNQIDWLHNLKRVDVSGNPLPQEQIDKIRRASPQAEIIIGAPDT